MALLLGLTALLLVAQALCVRAARRDAAQALDRPAEEWDAEDVERWLALIEPTPIETR
jgi:hypothetical protein